MQIVQRGLARSVFPFTRARCNSPRRDGRRHDAQVWLASRADHRELADYSDSVARVCAHRRVVTDRSIGGELRRRGPAGRSPEVNRASGAPLDLRSRQRVRSEGRSHPRRGWRACGDLGAGSARRRLARAPTPVAGSPQIHRVASNAEERRRRGASNRGFCGGSRRRPPVRGATARRRGRCPRGAR